jgi:hypothetical protein
VPAGSPQKRVAYRRIRPPPSVSFRLKNFVMIVRFKSAGRELRFIENGSEGIEPRITVLDRPFSAYELWNAPGAKLLVPNSGPVASRPAFTNGEDHFYLFLEIPVADFLSEPVEFWPRHHRRLQGSIQILQKTDEVGHCRPAVDANSFLSKIDLACMAGRAGHAEPFILAIYPPAVRFEFFLGEPDGQAVQVQIRFMSREITKFFDVLVASKKDQRAFWTKLFGTFRCFQVEEPFVWDDQIALGLIVELVSVIDIPLLIEKGKSLHRPRARFRLAYYAVVYGKWLRTASQDDQRQEAGCRQKLFHFAPPNSVRSDFPGGPVIPA